MRLTTEEIFRTYTDRLFAIAFTVCQNREDAEDAVQDKFVDGVCYVQLQEDGRVLYLTVTDQEGYTMSTHGYEKP